MLNVDDRRDLSCLGLMVLVYGLVVAPVLHTVVAHAGTGRQHVHGASRVAHSHGQAPERHAPEKQQGHKQDGHQHLTGAVEHLSGVVPVWAVVELPRVRWVSWLAQTGAAPTRVPGTAHRPTAMPQGP